MDVSDHLGSPVRNSNPTSSSFFISLKKSRGCILSGFKLYEINEYHFQIAYVLEFDLNLNLFRSVRGVGR